ncbi:MAG: Peptidoglycan bridge formation glycyltransferase FemA/FemB family protein, partial [Anaerolineales bacterium]|nr:Peptidoglycan bridge formation glycyltransferase FemA/FemB family protein [Anaerolineales bacterium]MBM2844234.1 Peptidoglycan bridge formation glycyltransferase FemA/FemB family protein [Anaerolineales bacterium]
MLPDLVEACRACGAFALILEPDADDPEAEGLEGLGFVPSTRSVQPATSVRVDLQGSEEDVLGRMHQKTR